MEGAVNGDPQGFFLGLGGGGGLAQHNKHDLSLEKPFKLSTVTLEWENYSISFFILNGENRSW